MTTKEPKKKKAAVPPVAASAAPEAVPTPPSEENSVLKSGLVHCKFCGRPHQPGIDGQGVNHDKFDVGSKAEIMYNAAIKDQKVKIFIPFEIGEKLGAVQSPCLNGLRVNILKGVYVDVPKRYADVIMESLNQTSLAYANVMTKNPVSGETKSARLDLADSARKGALNA